MQEPFLFKVSMINQRHQIKCRFGKNQECEKARNRLKKIKNRGEIKRQEEQGDMRPNEVDKVLAGERQNERVNVTKKVDNQIRCGVKMTIKG